MYRKLISYVLTEGHLDLSNAKNLKFTELKQHINNAIEGLFIFHGILFLEYEGYSKAVSRENVNSFCKMFYEITYNKGGNSIFLNHLNNLDLSYADLSHANLNNTDLTKTKLDYSILYAANLIFSDLSGLNLAKTNLLAANLIGANLKNTIFSDKIAIIDNLKFISLYLSGTNLSFADLSGADLSNLIFTNRVYLRDNSVANNEIPIVNFGSTILINADLNCAKINKKNQEFIENSGAKNIDKIIWVD